jgi:diaminopimelate decarboxylase
LGSGVLSRPFSRVDGELRCGDHSVGELADRFGTPVYLYDARSIRARFHEFREAFRDADPLIAYSVKANGNLKLLHLLREEGSGADIVSLGELSRCMQAGIPADKIVFAGVGKTTEEMAAALEARIYAFNVESAGELNLLNDVGLEMGVPAPFALRVNPDIEADTPHEYTRTGHARSKFGIPVNEVLELYRWARAQPGLVARGIDVHVGSQILDTEPYERALRSVLDLAAQLRAEGTELEFVDLGGGYGVAYEDKDEMSAGRLAERIVPPVRDSGLRLVLEPGRYIVGEAGVLVTRVQFVKASGEKTFVITDCGMTELLRPSHYQGYHRIEPVRERSGSPVVEVDVVGPICETGDFLARDRDLALPLRGDLLAVCTAGAYGFAMSSNYNGRARPAEVVVDGEAVTLARRRESLEDLVRGEWRPGDDPLQPSDA